MKKLVYVTATVLMIGCASTKLVAPMQTDADRMQDKYPGYTLAQLSEGKALYEKHCGQCHGYKNPAKFTESQWSKIVPKMTAKVNKKEGDVLDAQKQDLILKYVTTMCKDAS